MLMGVIIVGFQATAAPPQALSNVALTLFDQEAWFEGTLPEIAVSEGTTLAIGIPETTAVGIFQYLAPSLALMLAIFFFDEPFSMVQLISFVFVWISIVIFTAEAFHHHRAPPPAH